MPAENCSCIFGIHYLPVNNGHQSQVIDDKYNGGNGRSISYINDRNGEVLKRTETANIYAGTSSNVYQNYYYFNDVGIGDVGNDGNGIP